MKMKSFRAQIGNLLFSVDTVTLTGLFKRVGDIETAEKRVFLANPGDFDLLQSIMASGSSNRSPSGSKAFDFAFDDIPCSYEDYGNPESVDGSHSDSGIATNP